MKKIILSFCLFVILIPAQSQSTLIAGDIAFVGINSDGTTDDFDFVLLSDISAGTIINFTDCGWNHGTGFNTVDEETHCQWTATTELAAGTIVHVVTNNGNDPISSSVGSFSNDMMLISIAGDQILAYQGTKENPVFIAAISFNQNNVLEPADDFDGESISNATTALPTGLTMGLNAVHVYNPTAYVEQDNSVYDGNLLQGSKFELLKAINNRTKWNTDDSTPFDLSPSTVGDFILDASTLTSSTDYLTMNKLGETQTVQVISNTNWLVSSSESWLTVDVDASAGDGDINISSEANTNLDERTATVTISSTGMSPIVINVSQNGLATGNETVNNSKLVIYPTVVSDGFTVNNIQKAALVSIYNLKGNLVMQREISTNSFLNIADLKQGIYIVKVNDQVIKLTKI